MAFGFWWQYSVPCATSSSPHALHCICVRLAFALASRKTCRSSSRFRLAFPSIDIFLLALFVSCVKRERIPSHALAASLADIETTILREVLSFHFTTIYLVYEGAKLRCNVQVNCIVRSNCTVRWNAIYLFRLQTARSIVCSWCFRCLCHVLAILSVFGLFRIVILRIRFQSPFVCAFTVLQHEPQLKCKNKYVPISCARSQSRKRNLRCHHRNPVNAFSQYCSEDFIIYSIAQKLLCFRNLSSEFRFIIFQKSTFHFSFSQCNSAQSQEMNISFGSLHI